MGVFLSYGHVCGKLWGSESQITFFDTFDYLLLRRCNWWAIRNEFIECVMLYSQVQLQESKTKTKIPGKVKRIEVETPV